MKSEGDKKMAQTINISCNMMLLHAQDLLDQRIIENGSFLPHYTQSSAVQAIKEIVDMVTLTLNQDRLFIEYKYTNTNVIKFDIRRLQQVVLNLLSNAVKFQKEGVIKVCSEVVRR